MASSKFKTLASQRTLKGMQLTWEKYLQIIFLIKDLYSEYIKDSQLNNETDTQFKNAQKFE